MPQDAARGGLSCLRCPSEDRRRNRGFYMPPRPLLSKCVGVVNVGGDCHRNCAGVVKMNLRSFRLRETIIFEDNAAYVHRRSTSAAN